MTFGAATDPLDPLRRLGTNAREWAAQLSLKELLAVVEALEDVLIERHQPAAALLAQAAAMLRRQVSHP